MKPEKRDWKVLYDPSIAKDPERPKKVVRFNGEPVKGFPDVPPLSDPRSQSRDRHRQSIREGKKPARIAETFTPVEFQV